MTADAAIDMKISPEGRVVIPASVRRHLGVSAGDNVRFVVLDDGRVQIVSPRTLARELWANNTGGDAMDSTEPIRDLRQDDQSASALSESAQDEWSPEDGNLEANTARLLHSLDLTE